MATAMRPMPVMTTARAIPTTAAEDRQTAEGQQHQAAGEDRDGDRADDEESLHSGFFLSERMGSDYS